MTASGGEFISMIDPPEWAKTAVAECENVGGWPVLADPDGGRDIVLSSPIILYDHPEVAPESPGELYDGLEIDEILTLRTLALSDDEKLQARATDARAAALIDRVEAMDARDIVKLHGTVRSPRPAPAGSGAGAGGMAAADGQTMVARNNAAGEPEWIGDPDVPWWDPGADASVSPDTDTVNAGGHQIGRGSKVRRQPGGRGRGFVGVAGSRHGERRRSPDRPRQQGAAAAGETPQRRPGHVPDRADRRGPGGAARRGRQPVPGRGPRR